MVLSNRGVYVKTLTTICCEKVEDSKLRQGLILSGRSGWVWNSGIVKLERFVVLSDCEWAQQILFH